MRAWIAIVVFFGCSLAPAFAAKPEGRSQSLGSMRLLEDDELRVQLLGDVGLLTLDNDAFVGITVSAAIAFERWRIVARLPIRLRVSDRSPPGRNIVREFDWDEVGDYGRLLPHISFGNEGDGFHFRLGELADVTMGFGGLVERYDNTVDTYRYQSGLYASFAHEWLGGQVLVDDVFDPAVFVSRLTFQPLSGLGVGPLDGLRFGITAGADFSAPLRVMSGKLQPLVVDGTRRVLVEEDSPMAMLGLDVSMPIALFGDALMITPYASVDSLDVESFGAQFGVFSDWRFEPLQKLRLHAAYRYAGPRHLAGYVSSFYDVERFSYAGSQPKRGLLQRSAAVGHGFKVEADLAMPPWFDVGLGIAHDDVSGTDLWAHVALPNLGPVELRGVLVALDIDARRARESPRSVDRLWLAGQVRIRLLDWLHLRGAVKHRWRLDNLQPQSGSAERFEGALSTGLDAEVALQGQFSL